MNLLSKALFSFVAMSFLLTSVSFAEAALEPMGTMSDAQQAGLIEKYAPGYLVKWCIAEIASAKPSTRLLGKITHLYLPIIRGVHTKVDIKTLEPEEKAAYEEANHLVASLEMADEITLATLIALSERFMTQKHADALNEAWIKAGRLADFSNSLSANMTAGEVDIQGLGKLIEHGPALLDGSKHAADGEPMYEDSRHLGAHSRLASMMTWLNLIKKALSLKPDLRQKAGEAIFDARFAEFFKLIQDEFEKLDMKSAQKSPVGLFQLLVDAQRDSIEMVRGIVFSSLFMANGDVGLAFHTFFEQLGDVADALRRNRKFIALHRYGNNFSHTVINAVHFVYFAANPYDHYVKVLKRRFERIGELETFSEEWHTQVQDIVLTGAQPAIDVIYFYAKPDKAQMLLNFANTVTFGGANRVVDGVKRIGNTIPCGPRMHQSLVNNSRSILNWFQWVTFTAVQAGKFGWWLGDKLMPATVYNAVISTTIKTATMVTTLTGSAAVYAGRLGETTKTYFVRGITALWGSQIIEGTCETLFGRGCLDKGYDVAKTGVASVWSGTSQSRDEL